jgi:hypothetical protein
MSLYKNNDEINHFNLCVYWLDKIKCIINKLKLNNTLIITDIEINQIINQLIPPNKIPNYKYSIECFIIQFKNKPMSELIRYEIQYQEIDIKNRILSNINMINDIMIYSSK